MVMLRRMRVRRHLRTREACRRHRPLPGVQRCRREAIRRRNALALRDWEAWLKAEAKGKGVDVSDGIYCAYELYPKDLQGPAEYCSEPPEVASDYCYLHNPDRCEPDWDDRRKEALYDCD
jgi:hypothetical protein